MANENRLTKRDKVVYSAIAEFIKENKYPPSVRELGELTYRTSTATISASLRSLERKGYITTKKGANRTIRIVKDLEGNPIADAVEVVHGYWIDGCNVDHIGRITGHTIDCSVCDSVFKDDSRAVVKHWKECFKVCPFCGAKMDGDGNDNT